MERSILHVDCNKFYASVECLYRPEIRDKPVAVGGNPETRHGIILTKNEIASKYGLTVGEPLWKAYQKCPDLIVVPPNYPLYLRFSKLCRRVYEDYSEYIEPFGLDESWLDVTGNTQSAMEIAKEIRHRIKSELGITVSIGVSFNKIFAKLGSDYKKPDAITRIGSDNFRKIAWELPCSDLLFVGRSTTKTLHAYGIYTIGELANTDIKFLRSVFGKNGDTLHKFANGLDDMPVRHKDEIRDVKSVGNSTTTPRDLVNDSDVATVLRVLAESVAERLREQGFKGKTVTISVRDTKLVSFTRQTKLAAPTNLSTEIFDAGMALFKSNYHWGANIRSMGISVSDFDWEYCEQFDLAGTAERREKIEKIENTVDVLRRRFGHYCIQKACQMRTADLSDFNPHDEHIIHPIGYFA
ncbi:MAG: DNA polymerase IV [Eubacterium sp.]|nr:DNA polymerase IV [Eubacterium sp.]